MNAGSRTREDGCVELLCPAPGLFRGALREGDAVRGGLVLGALEVLGRAVDIVAPDAARGSVVQVLDPALARPAAEFGSVLYVIDPRSSSGAGTEAAAPSSAAAAIEGLVFRAPTSGRFYGRPTPDKPAFVTAGMELAAGTTICLLEVMKTFHRVTYSGTGARVTTVLVADGADVNAGDPLLALEAL
jgi:acetyl-CoA carboxylase biotin carboxyl carrier protein